MGVPWRHASGKQQPVGKGPFQANTRPGLCRTESVMLLGGKPPKIEGLNLNSAAPVVIL